MCLNVFVFYRVSLTKVEQSLCGKFISYVLFSGE